MTNEEILNKRWKVTDKTLKDYLKKFTSLKNNTLDDIIEIFDSLNITYSDLNKNISSSEKRRLSKKIDNWKEQGLLTGYFEYLVSSKNNKYTYSDLIEILLYGAYSNQQKEIDELSQAVFTKVANDIYSQALNEITIKPKKKFSLTWEYIWSLLWIPTVNKTWDDYLAVLTLTNVQEMQKKILSVIQQGKSIKEDDLKDLLQKQMNRIINISSDEDGDKYSGILNDTSRMLGNEIYIEPFKNNIEETKDQKLMVRFIAEIDKRTTKMCRSMSNELFYVNDLNKFTRYSDSEGAIVEYEVYGLQIGVNLPPITDHFHWCRSTITYNLDTSIPDIIREGLKIANDADKEQYERYKRYFEDKIPDGVENFVRWRYNNPDEWEKLKKEYPEMKLRYKIKNEYDLNINIDKFNRHVENTEQYQKYLNKQSTPSVLNIDIYEAQKIINEYAGTGELIRNNGNFQNKEFITTDIIVGRVFDINSTWKDTNKLIIHYSKTGAHIVPTLRR